MLSKKDLKGKQPMVSDAKSDAKSFTEIASNKPLSMRKTGSRNRNKSLNKSKRDTIHQSSAKITLKDDSNDIMNILKTAKNGTDISHLLTYSYSDDPSIDANHERTSKVGRSKHQKKKTNDNDIHLHGLSYINANYKFILNNEGDYKANLIDPNLPFNMNDIHRVIVKQHDYHCPICMGDEFVAPRMTKCGHIFCYPCLINMFENVRNDKTKTNLGNLHNPLISCPLCSEVIREKFPLLPVLIEQVKEGENKITAMSYRNVSLMYRNHSRIYSQAVSNFYRFKGFDGLIPWINHGCSPLNYKQQSPYTSFSRLVFCDIDFVISCFEKEIEDIMTQKLIDNEVYGDSGVYYDIASLKIMDEIKKLKELTGEKAKAPSQLDLSDLTLSTMSIKDSHEIRLPSFKDGYYFYQCDINSRIHYFLSPLDVKVINQLFDIPDITKVHPDTINFNFAYNLPISLNLFVENINFEEGRVTPELVSRNPYLSNLPYGAEVGFLEIDWSKFDASFIPISDEQLADNTDENSRYPIQIPQYLTKQLQNRTRNTKRKRSAEENARVRGELRREKETMEIFTKDDNAVEYPDSDEFEYLSNNKWNKNKFVHIHDFDSMPVLSGLGSNNTSETHLSLPNANDDNKSSMISTKTSVWGTTVPVVLDPEEEALKAEESRRIQEIIDKAKSEASSSEKGKKGKKGRRVKMVPLPL